LTTGEPRAIKVLPDSIRTAVEFRYPSWHADGVFEILEPIGSATA
jgi:hypothetical protein